MPALAAPVAAPVAASPAAAAAACALLGRRHGPLGARHQRTRDTPGPRLRPFAMTSSWV